MSIGDTYAKLFTPKPKRVGRPKGSGNLKPKDHKSTRPAKLSPELHDFVESNRRPGETISETIFRLIRENAHKNIIAQKKVDALQERLEDLESQRRFAMPLLNNQGVRN